MAGSPNFSSSTVAYNGKNITFRYINTHYDNISIIDIGSSHLGNASGSPYGINGTFFYNCTDATLKSNWPGTYNEGYRAYNNYRICINNGTVVRKIGDRNRKDGFSYGSCGVLGCLKTATSNERAFCESITNISDLRLEVSQVPLSNIKWAIGGSNLYLNDSSITEAAFNSKVKDQDSTYNGQHSRTAIFYRPNSTNNIVLLTAFASNGTGNLNNPSGGITLWQLRHFIRNIFGASCKGISLDGGGSSQIAYLKEPGGREVVQASQRAVRLMVKTTM